MRLLGEPGDTDARMEECFGPSWFDTWQWRRGLRFGVSANLARRGNGRSEDQSYGMCSGDTCKSKQAIRREHSYVII